MKRHVTRILAIHPGHGGIGFVVMEGPGRIVDWGIKTCRSSDATRILRRVESLISHYRPDVLLLARRTIRQRRSLRILRLCEEIRVVCREQGLGTCEITHDEIDAVFSRYGRTKQELALAVVHKLPQLSRWYPPRRRVWGGEDHRMKIFEAALLALTFYAACSERSSPELRHRSTKSANSDS